MALFCWTDSASVLSSGCLMPSAVESLGDFRLLFLETFKINKHSANDLRVSLKQLELSRELLISQLNYFPAQTNFPVHHG